MEKLSLAETPPLATGVSRLVLDDTTRQLRSSQLRIAELRRRLEELRAEKAMSSSCAEDAEELRRQVEEQRSEETKVLRRLYLLIKQMRPSLKSECLLRVAEVVSQNATVVVTEEAVERLSPFNKELVVKLLQEYLELRVC